MGRLHDANHACDDLLRATLGPATEVNIHFDPDRPGAYDGERPWTVAMAVRSTSRPEGPAPTSRNEPELADKFAS